METAGYLVGASFATRALGQTRSLYAAENCARRSSRNTWSTSTSIESFPHSGYQPTLYSESRCKADKVPGLLAKSRVSRECAYLRGQLAGKPRYHGED
jgi:hypothetical protein